MHSSVEKTAKIEVVQKTCCNLHCVMLWITDRREGEEGGQLHLETAMVPYVLKNYGNFRKILFFFALKSGLVLK